MVEGSYLTKIVENLSQCHHFLFIEKSLFHRGDVNNDNIGFPFFGGYKEYWNSIFSLSSSRKSNITSTKGENTNVLPRFVCIC